VTQAKSRCAAYDAAPNQIKKSEIFRKNTVDIEALELDGVRGSLTTLATNQGGSELRLRVEAGGATFSTESLMAPIPRGSPVYVAASEMKEGQCVVFSANHVKAASLTERAQVCDPSYFADITKLATCP